VLLILPAVVLCAALLVPAAPGAGSKDSKRWSESFSTSSCAWSSTGRNDFFVLEPGYQQIFEGHEGKDSVHQSGATEVETIVGPELGQAATENFSRSVRFGLGYGW